tara:strand:- start:12650 stop:13609 length:960 start_codon:yes stop_codon:yes gene_type:complete
MNPKNAISILLKGAAMGAANVIPGVSGGTVAFITGIYERLIEALKSFNLDAARLLLKRQFSDFLKHTDLVFLVLLGLGAVVSIVSIAELLKWAFEHHDTLVWAFFFGLIAASIPAVGRMVKTWGIGAISAAAVGLAAAVSMAFLGQAEQNDNFVYLMLCGVVGVCSMIIPGLSGSFVLLLMGNYQLVMIESVSQLKSLDLEAFKVLVPVGIGAVAGLVALSRILSWLFKNYHDIAVSLITGFIAGSLAIIWPWKDAKVVEFIKPDGDVKEKVTGYENWRLPDLADPNSWLAIGLIVVGAVLVILMERSANLKTDLPETS